MNVRPVKDRRATVESRRGQMSLIEKNAIELVESSKNISDREVVVSKQEIDNLRIALERADLLEGTVNKI